MYVYRKCRTTIELVRDCPHTRPSRRWVYRVAEKFWQLFKVFEQYKKTAYTKQIGKNISSFIRSITTKDSQQELKIALFGFNIFSQSL